MFNINLQKLALSLKNLLSVWEIEHRLNSWVRCIDRNHTGTLSTRAMNTILKTHVISMTCSQIQSQACWMFTETIWNTKIKIIEKLFRIWVYHKILLLIQIKLMTKPNISMFL
jgi:hypothetical protein